VYILLYLIKKLILIPSPQSPTQQTGKEEKAMMLALLTRCTGEWAEARQEVLWSKAQQLILMRFPEKIARIKNFEGNAENRLD